MAIGMTLLGVNGAADGVDDANGVDGVNGKDDVNGVDDADDADGVDDANGVTLVEAAMSCHPWPREVAAVAPLPRRETGVSEWSNV